MRTRTTQKHATPATPGRVWLHWGTWPSPDARLHISDTPERWAYVDHLECGKEFHAVLLVRYELRAWPWAERLVVPIEAVWAEGEAAS